MRKLAIMAIVVLILAGCGRRGAKNAAAGAAQGAEATTKVLPAPVYKAPDLPIYIQSDRERMTYMVEHYWDKVNLADPALAVNTDVLEQWLVDFIVNVQAVPEAVQAGLRTMMDKASANTDVYDKLIEATDKYLYDPNSPYRNEDLYKVVLEQQIGNRALAEDYKIAPRERLAMLMKNRVGEVANNFTYTTAQGAHGSLYGINADYVLVFFHNLGCPMCREVRLQLIDVLSTPHLAGMLGSGRLKILALYADPDMTGWDDHIGEIPATWIDAYDKAQDINRGALYDLRAIPSLYLLDKDKRVIVKDFVNPAVLEMIEN